MNMKALLYGCQQTYFWLNNICNFVEGNQYNHNPQYELHQLYEFIENVWNSKQNYMELLYGTTNIIILVLNLSKYKDNLSKKLLSRLYYVATKARPSTKPSYSIMKIILMNHNI